MKRGLPNCCLRLKSWKAIPGNWVDQTRTTRFGDGRTRRALVGDKVIKKGGAKIKARKAGARKKEARSPDSHVEASTKDRLANRRPRKKGGNARGGGETETLHGVNGPCLRKKADTVLTFTLRGSKEVD